MQTCLSSPCLPQIRWLALLRPPGRRHACRINPSDYQDFPVPGRETREFGQASLLDT